MNLKWEVSAEPISGVMLFKPFDIETYRSMSEKYDQIDISEKKKFKGRDDYISQNGGPVLSSEEKNYKKFSDEMDAVFSRGKFNNILPVDIHSDRDTLIDILTSLETENYIKTAYKEKKLRVTGELNTDTATRLTDSIRQGRSLLQAANAANMLSKPLIDFYAASAYAYATIVINSPLHKSIDSLKGSHGHAYNHLTNAVEFGGKTPSGTFIDLLASIYMPQIVSEGIDNSRINFRYSALPSLDFVQKHEIHISLMALLATVPELRNQAMHIPEMPHSLHPLKIKSSVKNETVVYQFIIGDGINKPSNSSLKKIFETEDVTEISGQCVVDVPASNIRNIMPTIYSDTRGRLWYVDPIVDGLYLPEICLHYLIISALCNIMRYSPHEWNNILSNKISSDFSLLISQYLRLFEIKYPMLVIQQLTNLAPVIKP